MLRYRQYSWQVALRQSPLPLFAGHSKVAQSVASNKLNINVNVYPAMSKNRKRKKEAKKEKYTGMGYRPSSLIRF
jgi:hypothetical protein